MKLGWLIATACLACLFSAAWWLALWGAPILSSRPLPLKDALGPGPGFFPLWLGLIGLSLSAILILEVARQPGSGPDTPSLVPERDAVFRIVAIVLLLAGAALVLDPLGFRITAFGFTLLALVALGIRSPIVLIVYASIASLGVFHVFYYWLKVPLPIGPYDYVLKPIGL